MRRFRAFQIVATILLSAVSTPLVAQVDFCKRVLQIPLEECRTLETLYIETKGYAWLDNTGWLIEDEPCYWLGIACSLSEWPRHVTRIRLIDNNVDGPLTGELTRLKHLETLIIENRVRSSKDGSLTGGIPSEISQLEKLEVLRLGKNDLVGFVPPEFVNLKKLRVLDLADNHLDRYIPPLLTKLEYLEELNLSGNQMSGPLLPTLADLTTLEELRLDNNLFYGTIPTTLGKLDSLRILDLSNNNLTGTIPASIGNLHSLFSLNLANNALGGSVPASIDGLQQLVILNLSGNRLNGAVDGAPAKFLSEIPFCDLSNNQPSLCLAGLAAADTAPVCSLRNQPNCGSTFGTWVSSLKVGQRADEVSVTWQMTSTTGISSILVEDVYSSRVLATISAVEFPPDLIFDIQLDDLEPGAYALALSLHFGDGTSLTGSPLNIQVLPGSLVLEAYPNPTQGASTIRAASYAGGEISINIVDMAGRLQRRFDTVLPTGGAFHEIPVDARTLPAGIYRLLIEDLDGNQAETMITVL